MTDPVLTLTNPIPGDSSATIRWEILWDNSDYISTDYTAVTLQFCINDVPGNSYNFTDPQNKVWETRVVPVDQIQEGIYTISNLVNNEDYLIYAFMVFRKKTDPYTLISITSDKIGPITPLANPLHVTLTTPGILPGQFDGKQINSNTTFMIQIELDDDFDSSVLPDYLMIMLIDNNSDTGSVAKRTIKVEWDELIAVDGNNLLKRYLLTELMADLAYEVSSFVVKGYQVSTVSNTIPVVATQKASVPVFQLDDVIFDYTDGDVTIPATIQEKGATPSDNVFQIKLYVLIGGVMTHVKTFDIANVFSETPVTFPYTHSFNTLELRSDTDNPIFNIGTTYTIALTSLTLYGESDRSSSFTFTPVKRLAPPIVRLSATASAITGGSVKITWTLPSLEGQTITRFQFFKTIAISEGSDDFTFTGVDPINVTPNINTEDYEFTGLTVATKYWFAMKIDVTDGNLNPNQFVTSVLSDEIVFATTYNAISAPTMFISYLEANVNGQAKLSWSALTNGERDNLDVTKYIIYSVSGSSPLYSYTKIDEVASNVLTYTKTGLTNGTLLTFAVSAEVTTQGSNSYVVGDGSDYYDVKIESAKSTVKSIVPWSKPSAPTLSFQNENFGNHWAKVDLTDNKLISNGLSFYRFVVTVNKTSNNDLVKTFVTESDSNQYITELPNGEELRLTPTAKYQDPNIFGAYITTADGIPSIVTPNFKDEDILSPQNVEAVNIGDNSVTINWTAPTITIEELNQKLTLTGYKVEIFEASDLSTAILTTNDLSTNILFISYNTADTVLVNGDSFKAIVTAIYDDESTEGTQTLLAPSDESNQFIPYEQSDPVTDIIYNNIGDSTVTINWTDPTYTGGTTIEIDRHEGYYEKYDSSNSLVSTSSVVTLNKPHVFTGLENGNNYKFFVRVVTINPNNPNNPTNEVYSSYTETETNAYPFLFDNTVGAISDFDITFIDSDVTLGSVTLGWSANTSLQGFPFFIEIYKDDTLVSTIANTDTPSTSYTSTNLTLGTTYRYKARIKFVNPNDPTITAAPTDLATYYGPFTHIESVIPYNDPSNPTGLVGTAGDTQIGLQWTRETEVNGLPVQGYNIYTLLETSTLDAGVKENWTKQNGSTLYTNAAAYVVNGLENGVGVKVKVTVVTQNINNDTSSTEDPDRNELLESDFGSSTMITVWPFTRPSVTVASVDIEDSTNETNTINWNTVTNTGGFVLAGYILYLFDGTTNPDDGTPNGTRLNTVSLITSSSTSYDHNYLNNGQSYSYYVKAVVLNKNDNDTPVESVASNIVTKIPFRKSNRPVITSPITELDCPEDIKLLWTFDNDSVDAGLPQADYKFVIIMNNLSQSERNLQIDVDDIASTEREINVIPGHLYSFSMFAQFRNPNDTSLTVNSLVSEIEQVSTFGYADALVDILSHGNGQVEILINPFNDINLKGGAFSKYIVIAKNTDGTNVSGFTPIIVTDQVRDATNPVIITGLTNETQYKIVVITVITAINNPSILHYGDSIYVIGKPGVAPIITNVTKSSGNFIITFTSNIYKPSFIHFFIEKHDGNVSTIYKQLYSVTSPDIISNQYTLSLANLNASVLAIADILRISVIAGNRDYGESGIFTTSTF